MTIETLEQFIILLNKVAADHTYDELISDAFTENILFTIEESKLKEYLIDRYGFTLAFVQSGF